MRPSPRSAALALLLGLMLLRIPLVGAVGLGDDEAYYALWARAPAASYFDHPPMVAWLASASVGLLGETPFSLRLPTVLCGFGALAALGALARRLGLGSGAEAALLLALTPMFAILGVFLAPDAPFLLFLLLSANAAWEAARRGSLAAWPITGLFAGFALLSKYNAVLWPISLFGFLASSPAGRAELRRTGPWLGAALALLLFAPVLRWNAEHGWLSFAFHLGGRPAPAGALLDRLGRFLGGQVGLLGPASLIALLGGLGALLSGARSGGAAPRFLLCAAAPPLLLFGLSAPFTDSKPHWTAAGWLFAAPAASAWLASRPRLRLGALASGGLLCALVFGQALHPLLPLPPKADVTNELYGWPEAARAVERLRAEMPVPERVFVWGHMYQTAAQVALLLPPAVPVTRLGGRGDQFDLWRSELPDLMGWDAIFVAHDKYDRDLGRHPAPFDGGCARAVEVPVERAGREVRRFRLWTCRGYRPKG